VLCLFGGFGCSIVSDEEEAIRVLCDLIFLIILRDKQKNNAKHSLAAIETITTSQHSFLSIIICGFFINYLTLFLDGRNERHSGLFFRQKMHYYWLFIYWNVISFLAGQRIPMSFVDFPHRWSTRTRFNDVLFKIVIPPLKRILTWHLIDARLFDYYCGNNWHNSYLLFSRSLSLCLSLYWLYSIDYSQRFHLLLDDTLDPMTVQRLVARKNTRK